MISTNHKIYDMTEYTLYRSKHYIYYYNSYIHAADTVECLSPSAPRVPSTVVSVLRMRKSVLGSKGGSSEYDQDHPLDPLACPT
jgi:hypothetical protein